MTLERAASPQALPWAQLDELFTGALGFRAADHEQPATAGGPR
jgi:hypothetical protein